MLSNDRKKYILKKASHDGIVSIPEVAAYYGVSVETIRRDVNDLCKENLLTKVHGGAVPAGKTSSRDSVIRRKKKNEPSKELTVGMIGAGLIKNGDIVMFDCGDFAQLIAQSVSDVKDVTFVTNSVTVASILLDKCQAGDFSGKIIMVGGELNAQGRFSSSPDTFDILKKYHSDICFVTASAVSADGVASQDSSGGSFSALMIKRSACPVLATESEKFGKNSLSQFAPISAFRHIITDTDNEIPEDLKDIISSSQVDFSCGLLK